MFGAFLCPFFGGRPDLILQKALLMNTPQFAGVPESARAQCVAVYTDRTGVATPNRVELLEAAENGTKVTQIAVKAAGVSVAGLVLVFITDTSGNNPVLFDEISYAAATPSNTLQSARNVATYDDLQLKAGQKILVGATAISGVVPINVIAQRGDF